MKLGCLLLLGSGLVFSQASGPTVFLPGLPPGGIGGTCTNPNFFGYLSGVGQVVTCVGGVWTVATGGGAGTVSVVGGGSLANAAVVTGGGAQTIQTPSTTSTLDSSGNLITTTQATNGTTPGEVLLTAGAGSIPALAANSAGFAGPATSGTSYLLKLPATITPGLLTAAAPATADGVNESAVTTTLGANGLCAQWNATGLGSAAAACGTGGGGSAGATLFSSTASVTVVATSPTTLIGAGVGSTTVPANTFTAGQFLEVFAQGFYSTPSSAVNLTIGLLIGGSTRISAGPFTVPASVTNGTWRVICGITTRTTGVSGTQIANCLLEITSTTIIAGETSMTATSAWTIDTTATQAIDLQATWSSTTGAPTITATNIVTLIPGAPAATQKYAVLQLLNGYCHGATYVSLVTWGANTPGILACADTAGTNNFPVIGGNSGVRTDLYFSIGLPDNLTIGATAIVAMLSQSGATTGSSTTNAAVVCANAPSPPYNTASSFTIANPGVAFTAYPVTITGIDMTGCTASASMMLNISFPAANPGSNFMLGNAIIRIPIN